MSSKSKDENEKVQLPSVLAIGFAGHRVLPDEAASGKILYDILEKKKRETSDVLIGVSSVAAGGDLLFAESCLALNIPLRVLLPMAAEEFRSDFDGPTWDRVQQVIARALSIEVTGSEGQRDECYYECGLSTVLQSQYLIALWDGELAHGLGGTEQIVRFALEIGRPFIWIHSLTGAVQFTNGKNSSLLQSDAELEFLNKLKPAVTAITDGSSAALAVAWQRKLDANAVMVAPQVRKLAAVPIICTAIAAVVSGGASRMHASGVWTVAGATLGITAAALPIILKLSKRQAVWVRIRTAAEVSRSCLALWQTPAPYKVVGPEILPELSGMIVSLNFLKSRTARTSNLSIASFKERYLEDRLLDQKQYFLKQSDRAALKGKRFRSLSKICVVCAVATSMWTFGSNFLLKVPTHASRNTWLPLATSTLFQVATMAGALLVVNDCDRRQRRYREIYNSLARWESELKAFRTWPPVLHVVNNIERALLVELLEWRSILQNTKIPRN